MLDQNYYRKNDNGRYEACGVRIPRDYLPDGIWLVRHHNNSRSKINLDLIQGAYRLGESEKIDFKTIAGLEDLTQEILNSQEFLEVAEKGISLADLIRFVIGKLYKNENS